MKYKSKSYTIDAYQWTGNTELMYQFLHSLDSERKCFNFKFNGGYPLLFIKNTSESIHPIQVPNSYYVIKEHDGFDGFYFCDPIIFNLKYKPE